MNLKLYVANVPYEADESDLEGHFNHFGDVSDVAIVRDRESGDSRGFAFVTMETQEGAIAATEEGNGSTFQGRTLKVQESRNETKKWGGRK